MLYAAIDIHKRLFQAAVFDPGTGEVSECRFAATREELNNWAMRWQGEIVAVTVEATTGWRWVVRELQARGFDVRLADPVEAKARRVSPVLHNRGNRTVDWAMQSCRAYEADPRLPLC
jgi:transposase